MSLDGKYALITGSSRGIGRGIALKLAANHVNVAVHYFQNKAAANNTLAEIRKLGSEGFVVQADVSRPEQIEALFNRVEMQFGKLDIFVSNARPEVFALTYAQGSRTGGLQPWAGMGSAKAALESLVRYFAVALAKRGITVNAISPGWTEDSVFNTLPTQAQDLIRNWHTRGWTPMGRLGTPEDIGNVVAMFCSEDADWITGQVIYADGGASLMNPEVPPEIQLGS